MAAMDCGGGARGGLCMGASGDQSRGECSVGAWRAGTYLPLLEGGLFGGDAGGWAALTDQRLSRAFWCWTYRVVLIHPRTNLRASACKIIARRPLLGRSAYEPGGVVQQPLRQTRGRQGTPRFTRQPSLKPPCNRQQQQPCRRFCAMVPAQ